MSRAPRSTLNSPSTSKLLRNDPSDPALLKGLNPQQQEAVRAADGPVLIIAGAGTGKTRVIAHRVAYLLQACPDVRPENILAVTFSRKAAAEMMQRIEQLLGSYADELEVATFHGFCHRFLQDHAMEVGLPGRFQLLDRAESWIFFRKLLPELKPSHYWNLSNPTDCIDPFLRFIGRAKDELVGPEELAAHVQQIQDPDERSRAAEVERAYRLYQKKLEAAGCLDFGDLIFKTYQGLTRRPELLAQLQAKYRYLLVDEFQDTNVAQVALLRMLAGPSANLCVVGDDDQAIYRFRGASFASFLLMKEAFPQVRTIRLTENYRATENILSVADRLISHNGSDRYDPEKHLTASKPKGLPVEVMVAKDDQQEARIVVERVLQAGGGDSPRRIAVLYRAHAHRHRLVEALRQAGIPFTVQGGSSLFDQPEIKELVSFLRILHDPSDSVELFRVLSHSIWGIPLEELVVFTRAAKEKKIGLQEILASAQELPVSETTRKAVQSFIQEFSELRRTALRSGIAEIVPLIAEQSFLRTIFLLPPEGESDPLVSLGKFLRFTYRYAQTHPTAREIGSFLWYVDSYIEAGGGDIFDEEQPEEPSDHRLRLMSVHQAKGLEFDEGILIGAVQGKFPSRSRPELIPFPIELMKERLPQGDYHVQEERRLCYVACTRAKERLLVLTRDRAYHRPSAFVREMLGGSAGDVVRKESAEQAPAPVETPAAAAGSLAAEREVVRLLQKIRSLDPGDSAEFRDAVSRIADLASGVLGENRRRKLASSSAGLLPQQRFSFTQLQAFHFCALKYKFAFVYQIPIRPTPQMAFGVDIHACLEGFYRQVMTGHVPPLEELLDTFRRCYTPGRYGEPYQDQEYQRLGIEMLSRWYSEQKDSFGIPLHLERPFTLPLGSGSLRWVVDRIDPLPGGFVEIIDYKTGKPKQEADDEEQLQLRLYALAAKEVFGLQTKRVSFYYLRTNEKLSFEQRAEDFPATQQKLQELVTQVQGSDFTPSPSPRKCRLCDFRNLCPSSMA